MKALGSAKAIGRYFCTVVLAPVKVCVCVCVFVCARANQMVLSCLVFNKHLKLLQLVYFLRTMGGTKPAQTLTWAEPKSRPTPKPGGAGGAPPRPNTDLGGAQVPPNTQTGRGSAPPNTQTGRGSAPPNTQTPTDLGGAQVLLRSKSPQTPTDLGGAQVCVAKALTTAAAAGSLGNGSRQTRRFDLISCLSVVRRGFAHFA